MPCTASSGRRATRRQPCCGAWSRRASSAGNPGRDSIRTDVGDAMRDNQGRPPLRARAARFIGTALLIAGVTILLTAGALQLYANYAQLQWEREQQALSNQFVPAEAA